MADEVDPTLLYTVRQDRDGRMLVEMTDEGLLRRLHERAQTSTRESEVVTARDGSFFLAEREADGHYRVTLTDEGVRKFETALGLADDFGRHRTISTHSTIGDIMDRTATREELSDLSRQDRRDAMHRLRLGVLRARYRGSEEPSTEQKTVSHGIKAVVVGLIGLWTLKQFGIALQDVQDIPGILANIPSDILHLDPGHAIGEVGNRVNDATSHVVLGAEGTVGTYIAAKMVRPFSRMYRKDQLVTGGRPILRFVNWTLRHFDRGKHGT
ncbi:MAG: hypothetical protein NVSMB52_07830 [Chloroflexota bacterium]